MVARTVGLALAAALVLVHGAAHAATHGAHVRTAAARPNILHIIADDLGWNEMSWQNNTRDLLTPNLAALANAGVALKQFCECTRVQRTLVCRRLVGLLSLSLTARVSLPPLRQHGP